MPPDASDIHDIDKALICATTSYGISLIMLCVVSFSARTSAICWLVSPREICGSVSKEEPRCYSCRRGAYIANVQVVEEVSLVSITGLVAVAITVAGRITVAVI
jgi:hypothetical protein